MSDLLPGLKEALGIVLDANECSDVGDELTMTAEAIQARIDELERAQINALNNSAAGEAQSASRQPSEPGGHGVASMRSAPSGAPINAGAEPAIIQKGPIAHSVPLYEEPATKAAGQENTADRSQGSVFSRSGLRAGGCPNEPAPAATVPLSATEREVMRKARAAASRIVSRIAAAPQITDAPGVAQVETTAERVAPASSVPLTEEEIEQVYEDARDYWLNDSEARGEMRELGIPPEADAVVKCDMKTLRALCDLALAGLRAKKGTP